MDISSVIGVVSGIGFVIGTILLGGSIMMFVNIPSILVVMGGNHGRFHDRLPAV